MRCLTRFFVAFIAALLLCVAFPTSQPAFAQTCTPPPSGMVLWLAGDGNARDLSAAENSGIEGTQTTFAAGKVAQAFQFNGDNNSNISVPDKPSLHPTTAITIDAWVNPGTGNNGFPSIVFKGNIGSFAAQPYGIFFVPNTRQINIRLGNESTVDSLTTNGAIPLNAYTHVALTYDGTTISLYLNGVLDISKTTTIGTLNQTETNPLIVGSFNDNFIGAVDELEIFNRALSQTEIQAIVNADSAGKCKPATPPPATTCTAPPANLSAWFPGDGNPNDISGNNNTGTLGGSTTFTNGKVGQAFQFNGDNTSTVTVPDSGSLRASNALTIDAWINPSAASGDIAYRGCFGNGNCQPYGLLFTGFTQTSGRVVLSLGNETTFERLTSGTPIPFNTYTHVTGTYDGTTMRLYINGVFDISKTTTIGTLNQSSTLPLFIGQGADGVFSGAIDELEIFKRALSSAEIYAIYNAGSFGKCKPTPANPGQIIISEFRESGANGTQDEFIELYNNTDNSIGVATNDNSTGWSLVSSDAVVRATIPLGTYIPPRGHYLIANSNGYALGLPDSNNDARASVSRSTATRKRKQSLTDSFKPDSANFVTPFDRSYNTDIPNNTGLALFRTATAANFTAANALDAVGFNGTSAPYFENTPLASITPSGENYSFVRKASSVTGLPQDTDNNAQDFVLISTMGSVGGTNVQMGAPGPETLSSPILKMRPLFPGSLIEPTMAQSADPNRVILGSGNNRMLSIRRRFTNMTGATVNTLRFRVVDITTLNTPVASAPQADLRLTSSSDTAVPPTSMGVSMVKGTTLEVPAQPNGGGLNSTVTVALPAGGLSSTSGGICAAGQQCSVDLQYLLNIVTPGKFRFFVNIETLP
jgi:hypothetical protein